jgi:N utilization substance protein B
MLHRTDVPDEVAIDEAVEAAKELCAAEAPKFVNGILGAIKRTERTPSDT